VHNLAIFGPNRASTRARFRKKFIRVCSAPRQLALYPTTTSTVIHTDNQICSFPINLFVMSATSSAAETSIMGQSRPSGPSQIQTLSARGANARTWYFTFDMQASEAGVASQLKAFESSPFRTSNLTAASLISFSFTDGSPEIRGYTSGLREVTCGKNQCRPG
jgi:hypothetical protein